MTNNIGTNTDPTIRSAAIETSGRRGSVAVGIDGQMLTERTLSANARHAVELMPALEALCLAQGWNRSEKWFDHLYLSLGPGSFTGLRIAVAIARGMAQAIGCRLVGVPSLDVIAENAPADAMVVVPLLDAKRGQVFAARYERNSAGKLAATAAPALVDPAAFLKAAAEHGKVAVLGEGVAYHRPAIESVGAAGVGIVDESHWFGRASTVLRLGWEKAERGEFSDPATLLPIYIRLAEAEEVWRKKHGVSLE